MFGSNILEVAVGVIFVYLLLSLICTVINEGIATIINQRGKVLIAGIQNLLNDRTLSGLAQQLYNHGLVVGISKNGNDPNKPNGLPSYMLPATFALSLLDILRSHGAIIKDKQDQVNTAKQGGKDQEVQAAQAELTQAKTTLSGKPTPAGSNQNLRSASEIAEQLQAGAETAQQVLASGRELVSKYATWDSIEAAIAALPDSTTKDSLTVLLSKTQREITKSEEYLQGLQRNIEQWFDQAMDRFAGWYKRWAQWVSLPVAAILVILCDADTIKVAKKLLHESLTQCAIREVHEETGLQIRITGLIGTYTDPHILIAYSDGEVRQEFTFVYAAEIESGDLKIDDESKEASWVPLMSAVELPLAESQRRRLKDVLEYQKDRQPFLR
jgi:ADP-ribose pyrophosphatase YjhB (NUDIX family)